MITKVLRLLPPDLKLERFRNFFMILLFFVSLPARSQERPLMTCVSEQFVAAANSSNKIISYRVELVGGNAHVESSQSNVFIVAYEHADFLLGESRFSSESSKVVWRMSYVGRFDSRLDDPVSVGVTFYEKTTDDEDIRSIDNLVKWGGRWRLRIHTTNQIAPTIFIKCSAI